MDLSKIKEQVAHLPHVKKVWVKDGDVYIHAVKGSKEIDLSEETKEIKLQEEPAKPKKNK